VHAHTNETQNAETSIECSSTQVPLIVHNTEENGKAVKDQNCFSQSLMRV